MVIYFDWLKQIVTIKKIKILILLVQKLLTVIFCHGLDCCMNVPLNGTHSHRMGIGSTRKRAVLSPLDAFMHVNVCKHHFGMTRLGKYFMLFTFVFVMGFVVELACSTTNQQQTADPCMTNIPMLIALHCATVGIRQMTWNEKLSMQSTYPLNPFQQSYCCIAIMQWAAMPNMARTCMDMK